MSGEGFEIGWEGPPHVAQVRLVAGNTVGTSSDQIVEFTSTSSAYSYTVPATPATGQMIIVKDGSGAAGTHNISITGTVDGATNNVISTNYGVFRCYFDGTSWFTW